MAQITELESPQGLTEYFASPASFNHAWLVLNGSDIVGWHIALKDAQNACKCFHWLSVVKVYKSINGG